MKKMVARIVVWIIIGGVALTLLYGIIWVGFIDGYIKHGDFIGAIPLISFGTCGLLYWGLLNYNR